MLRGLIRVRATLRTFGEPPGRPGASIVPAVLERLRQEPDEPEPPVVSRRGRGA